MATSAQHRLSELPTAEPNAWQSTARQLAAELAESAGRRDREGGTAFGERDAIRASGLLSLTVERTLGGLGGSFGDALSVVRTLASADPALAHLFGFHHLMLATVQLFGDAEQTRSAHADTVDNALFWGNALNPKDERTRLRHSLGALQLDGEKSFCSGARDSDRLIVSAIDEASQKLIIAFVPTGRDGIETLADWDAFGQRQTDSGTVRFSGVALYEQEILRTPGPLGSPRASLRPCLAQALLAHVYLGIAEGAWAEARSRFSAQTGVRQQDPYLLHRAGSLVLALNAAQLFAERARQEIDSALAMGDAITPKTRGEVAVHVARAKVSASQSGLQIAQDLFELLGPRATTREAALDRYWRNIRVHSLHDPIDHKLRELGEHGLFDRIPMPSFYA